MTTDPNPDWLERGTLVPADGAHPILLNGSVAIWRIEHGGVDVFAVPLEAGVPAGAREHACRFGPGQVLFGLDVPVAEAAVGLLAVGLPHTQLRRLDIMRESLFGYPPPDSAPADADTTAAVWLDDWVRGLTRIISEPAPRVFKRPDFTAPLGARTGDNVYTQSDVIWVQPPARTDALDRMPAARPLPAGTPFPLTPSTWLHVKADQDIVCASTIDVVRAGAALEALDVFHAAFLDDLRQRRAQHDQAIQRQLTRQQQADAVRFGSALAGLAGVISDDNAGLTHVIRSNDPTLDACQLVLSATGVNVQLRGDAAQAAQPGSYVRYLARQAKVALRQVALTGERWWREDAGPLLAFRKADGGAVALLPVRDDHYLIVDPATGSRTVVDRESAAGLAGTAFMFFRSFPDQAIGVLDLLRFGLGGAGRDVARLFVFGALGGLLGLFTPIATGLLIDTVIPSAQHDELLQLVLLLLTAAFGISAFELTRGIALLRIKTRTDNAVQSAIIHRLLRLPAPFFRDYAAGDLALRAFGIGAIIHLLMTTTQSALFAWIFGLFSYVYLFFLNWQLALLATVLAAISLALTTAINFWRLRMERRMFQLQGDIASRVFQILNGIAKLRAGGAERRAFSLWADQFSRQKTLDFDVHRIANYLSTLDAGYIVLTSLMLFGMVALFKTDISTGTFLAFNAAFSQFLAATLAMSAALTGSLNAIPLYERAKPIMHTLPEASEGRHSPGELSGDIDINHVGFRYLADGPLILDDISIRIEPGEFVAFVGPSGSGKSTLFRLLLGFERPQAGAIYYDGQDLAGLDIGAVRRQLGVVLQNGRLMPGDIFTNIVGSSPYTLDDAWEAARMAGFEDDIKSMPMGMHTVIAEGAGTLSGGQKQRLMIARAIARRPRILLFDEATSALDNTTQAIVAQSVEQLNATRIVIAHRLSTIVRADRIVVIDAGRVVETGNYEELMARNGPFVELAKRQIA